MKFLFKISEKIYELLNLHGPILLILISLIFLSNLFKALIFGLSFFIQIDINYPKLLIFVLFLISIINIYLMIKLFILKKWAFYAYCFLSIIAFLINFIYHLNFIDSLKDLLLPFFLIIFYLPKRKAFI